MKYLLLAAIIKGHFKEEMNFKLDLENMQNLKRVNRQDEHASQDTDM